jgi:hypothetical protein
VLVIADDSEVLTSVGADGDVRAKYSLAKSEIMAVNRRDMALPSSPDLADDCAGLLLFAP